MVDKNLFDFVTFLQLDVYQGDANIVGVVVQLTGKLAQKMQMLNHGCSKNWWWCITCIVSQYYLQVSANLAKCGGGRVCNA